MSCPTVAFVQRLVRPFWRPKPGRHGNLFRDGCARLQDREMAARREGKKTSMNRQNRYQGRCQSENKRVDRYGISLGRRGRVRREKADSKLEVALLSSRASLRIRRETGGRMKFSGRAEPATPAIGFLLFARGSGGGHRHSAALLQPFQQTPIQSVAVAPPDAPRRLDFPRSQSAFARTPAARNTPCRFLKPLNGAAVDRVFGKSGCRSKSPERRAGPGSCVCRASQTPVESGQSVGHPGACEDRGRCGPATGSKDTTMYLIS